MREDFAALRFHTAIARIIELTAHASRLPHVPRALTEPLVLMVAPLAPHIAEELWQRLGHPDLPGPRALPASRPGSPVAAETVTLPVQVNGKVRFTIEVPASATRDDIAELLARPPRLPPRRGGPPGHRARQDRQHRPPLTRANPSSSAGVTRTGTSAGVSARVLAADDAEEVPHGRSRLLGRLPGEDASRV